MDRSSRSRTCRSGSSGCVTTSRGSASASVITSSISSPPGSSSTSRRRPSLNPLIASRARWRAARPRRRTAAGSRAARPAALDRRRPGPDAGRGGRLRRLLLVAAPRHEPRPHPAARRRAAAAELAPPPRRLPRPVAHGRRRAARRSPGRRVSCRTRSTGYRGSRRPAPSTSSSRSGSSSAVTPTACIEPDHADRHVFGVVLLNDWSAPRHPGLRVPAARPAPGKSFATTISPWVVTLDALRPYLVEPPVQDPVPDPYLRAALPWGLDLDLTVELNGQVISGTNFSHMYWTFAQQLAHMTVNGAPAGAGDLFGSGTVSGPTQAERGSLVELTWRGAEPLELPDGTTRTFLEDGDTVTLRGWCGGHDGPGSASARPRARSSRHQSDTTADQRRSDDVLPTVGDIPRKRHTLHRVGDTVWPRSWSARRASPGRRACCTTGRSPSAIVRIEQADVTPADVRRQPAGAAAPPPHVEAAERSRRRGHVTDRAARQRRRAAAVRHRDDDEPAVPQRRRRRARLRAVG